MRTRPKGRKQTETPTANRRGLEGLGTAFESTSDRRAVKGCFPFTCEPASPCSHPGRPAWLDSKDRDPHA